MVAGVVGGEEGGEGKESRINGVRWEEGEDNRDVKFMHCSYAQLNLYYEGISDVGEAVFTRPRPRQD